MIGKPLLRLLVALALSALLGACTQKNTADQDQGNQGSAAGVAIGLDRFLLFPNPVGLDPLAQDGGTFETNTNEYAAAYYRAIDPGNAKDTIDKWRAQNGFTGYAAPARPGTEHLAVFRDVKDLGYGRRMTGRINTSADPNVNNSVAFFGENYDVSSISSGGYSSFNVEAAIARDSKWHVGTNAIEWSTASCNTSTAPPEDPANCNSGVKFAKFYNFSSATGQRQLRGPEEGLPPPMVVPKDRQHPLDHQAWGLRPRRLLHSKQRPRK